MNPLKTSPLLLQTALLLLPAAALAAESGRIVDYDLGSLPSYQPQEQVSGVIRLGGHGFEQPIVQKWEDLFQKFQPQVRFENNLRGTATGIAAVYLDLSDMGLMGREIWHIENDGFWRGKNRVPLGIKVTTGTYSLHGDACTLGFFVNKANPIAELTLAQLDAIFGFERLRGAPGAIRKWGDLGLTGTWADKPIELYGDWLDCGEAEYLRETVLLNSNLWNTERYHQFWNDIATPGGGVLVDASRNWLTDRIVLGKILVFAGQKAIDALAKDLYGIGWTSVCYDRDTRVKALALAGKDGDPYVKATAATVFDRTYPLPRSTYIYLDRPDGRPVDPRFKEFLRLILSREGQEIVRDGKMVPLNAQVVLQERRKLD